MIQIRAAVEADVSRILEISNWAAVHTPANFANSPELLSDWLTSYRSTHAYHPWLVATEDERVIGFAKSSPHKSRCAYAWSADVSVYIDGACQARGIGRALYDKLIPLLREQGYQTLIAGIVVDHLPSEKLHAAVGFVRCGIFPRVGFKQGRWRDVGYWALQLGAGEDEAPPVRRVPKL